MDEPGLTIFGITGRMGQSLIQALREGPGLRLVGAVASSASERLGSDAAAQGEATGVIVTADPLVALQGASVALDFSAGDSVQDHAKACGQAGVPLLVGATGLDPATRAALEALSQRLAVLIAPNTSVGVSVMAELVAQATTRLGNSYDVEIAEAHHRLKRDAPSGTALALGEAVAQARGQSLAGVAAFDRHGSASPRVPGSIGFSVLRAGDIVGEHTVTFAAAGERLEITHRASDRITFARGALRAARWLWDKPAGLYGMRDVLTGMDSHGRHR